MYGMPAIPLSHMFISFLLTLILWVVLMVYLKFFIRRRHKLIERYKMGDSGGVVSVLGNVLYDQPSGFCATLRDTEDYAYITYKYPISTIKTKQPKSEKTADFVSGIDVDNKKLIVEKKIRTYFPYHRESITILLLPDLPLSGQPLDDIDRDLSSFQSSYAERSRDQMKYSQMLCGLWVTFCFLGAFYILHQMSEVEGLQIEEGYNVENVWLMEHAQSVFYVMTMGVTPVVAVGVNVVKWWWYYRWMTDQGVVTEHPSKIVPLNIDSGDLL